MGRAVFPPYYVIWDQAMVEVMKTMVTSFKSSHVHTATLSAPNPAEGHRGPTMPPETPGHSGNSGSVSCRITAPFFWVLLHTRFCLCPPWVCFPSLCRFWWLYGGVNGNLLQQALRHTQVCCTQSPCPCSRPLQTHTSTGDMQTVKGSSVSVSAGSTGVHKVLFEPSECLCWVWVWF